MTWSDLSQECTVDTHTVYTTPANGMLVVIVHKQTPTKHTVTGILAKSSHCPVLALCHNTVFASTDGVLNGLFVAMCGHLEQ